MTTVRPHLSSSRSRDLRILWRLPMRTKARPISTSKASWVKWTGSLPNSRMEEFEERLVTREPVDPGISAVALVAEAREEYGGREPR